MADRADPPGLWVVKLGLSVAAALFIAGFARMIVRIRQDVPADDEEPSTLGQTLFVATVAGVLMSATLMAPVVWLVEGGFKLVLRAVRAALGAARSRLP